MLFQSQGAADLVSALGLVAINLYFEFHKS